MSREIKFRAWDELKKTMIFGGAFMDVSQTKSVDRWVFGLDVFNHPDDVSELMQYTGLKDRHGVEIYEGDILRGKDGNYSVVWSDHLMQWTTNKRLMLWAFNEPEVIGNIHANPELIKD